MTPERERLIRSLFEAYIEMYASRDVRLLDHFSENFSGYAGSSDVLVKDRKQWAEITRLDFSQVGERIRIEMLDLSLQDLADDVVVVTAFFHIHLPVRPELLAQETARLVLVYRQEGQDWKIVHSGISIPFGLARDGEIYPMTNLLERNRELEKLVETRTLALAEANRQLEVQSHTDGLTGIANRRSFDTVLAQEWNRGLRARTRLALIMIDVDFFKDFNDGYGHMEGDACLRSIAGILAGVARRAGETAARYGGEEFAILLPNAHEEQALDIARQVRHEVSSLRIVHEKSPHGIVTISLGVASLTPSPSQTMGDLVRTADAALYRAKQSGRNRVCSAPPQSNSEGASS